MCKHLTVFVLNPSCHERFDLEEVLGQYGINSSSCFSSTWKEETCGVLLNNFGVETNS